MKYRNLGRTGVQCSEVGLGCWQFGGDFGPMADETAHAIMEASLKAGVNFFDTADVYGGGHSETLVGVCKQRFDGALFVATKHGRGGGIHPDKYSEEILRKQVAQQRERLGVETIDLLQLHCVPTEVLRDGAIFGWLRKLRDEGIIRHFGASVETVEEGLICCEVEGLASLQVIFNIFRQKPARELFPVALEKGVGIIVRLPLASGLLSGKFTAGSTFADSDHRNFNRDGAAFNVGETFAGLPFDLGVALADRLKPLVPGGMTMAQFALRWILDHEAVSVIIPGASSVEQARANAVASDLDPLPAELHEELQHFYESEVAAHIRGPY